MLQTYSDKKQTNKTKYTKEILDLREQLHNR